MLNVSVTDMVLQPGVTRQPHTTPLNAALFNQDGSPFTALSSEANQAAAQADVAAVTSTVAAGATPTKAEFDALRADALATRTVLNALLAKLRTAELVAAA
jgi:hypothetical protein